MIFRWILPRWIRPVMNLSFLFDLISPIQKGKKRLPFDFDPRFFLWKTPNPPNSPPPWRNVSGHLWNYDGALRRGSHGPGRFGWRSESWMEVNPWGTFALIVFFFSFFSFRIGKKNGISIPKVQDTWWKVLTGWRFRVFLSPSAGCMCQMRAVSHSMVRDPDANSPTPPHCLQLQACLTRRLLEGFHTQHAYNRCKHLIRLSNCLNAT